MQQQTIAGGEGELSQFSQGKWSPLEVVALYAAHAAVLKETEGEDCDWTNINECTIGDWSGYGTCSRDCGTGRKFRTREILETGPNAAACPPLTDWASCNPEHCRKFYFTAVLNSC